MPRRRMIDPSFNEDMEVGGLTRDERLFLVGCISVADDEGRLIGNCEFLKSRIFIYDKDIDSDAMRRIRESTLEKMSHWRPDNVFLLRAYQDSDQDYIFFANWSDSNKPSHPTPSKLPAPPKGIPEETPKPSSDTPELVQSRSGGSPSQVRSGQSRSGKVSIGQVREVQEDFTNFLTKSESDLTDFLLTTLTKYISAGREQATVRFGGLGGDGPGDITETQDETVRSQWGILVLHKFWEQAVGKVSTEIFQGSLQALKKYPLSGVATAFVKAARYQGGKHRKWKYIQTVLDEQMKKGSHSERSP